MAEAQADDMSRAVGAARTAFDEGPWPRLTHARAGRVPPRARRRGAGARRRPRRDLAAGVGDASTGSRSTRRGSAPARSSRTPRWPTRSRSEERAQPTMGGGFGLLVREPVGVVGAIIPWNAPLGLDLAQGRARAARRLHGRAEVVARGARRGLPRRRGRRADRAAAGRAQRGDRRPRGVGAARRATPASTRSRSPGRPRRAGEIASICGERIARCTLELGGKSAAVDPRRRRHRDRGHDARRRRVRHDRPGVLVAHADRGHAQPSRRDASRRSPRASAQVRVGDPFDEQTQMGPLAIGAPARPRVEGYIAKGIDEGATLATGGGRPEGPRPRLVRRADRLRQRRQRLDDRPGGDLRTGARA